MLSSNPKMRCFKAKLIVPVFQGPCIEDVDDSAIADNLSENKFGSI